MSKDIDDDFEDDLEDDFGDDFDLGDDFGLDDFNKEVPPPKDSREAIGQVLDGASSELKDTMMPDKAELAKEMLKRSIPTKVRGEVDTISDLASYTDDTITGSYDNEVKPAIKDFLNTVKEVTPEGGKIETFLNVVGDKLGVNGSDSSYDNEEDINEK